MAQTKSSVGYVQLLRQNSRFRWLWTAQLISSAGDWFNNVAVLGLVLELTRSGLSASLVILCSTLPSFFLIPVVGPIVDRFDRRQIMIITNFISAGVALLFLLVHGSATLWLVYLTTVLLIVSASFFGPASLASIPNIVSAEELFPANALSSAAWGIMVMVGSALGGIVSQAFGRDIAFIINAISFLVAAVIIATLKIPSPKAEKQITPWRDFAAGIAYIRDYLPSFSMVMVKTGWGLAGGAIVLLSVFGNQVFKGGDAAIGALYAARGLGALIGPLMVQGLVGRDIRKLRDAIWMGFLVCGAGYLLFAASGWLNALWLGCIALFLAHFGGGITWVISSVLLQITTPDRFRGRVFAVDYGLSTLTNGASTLLYGVSLQAGVVPMLLALIGAFIFAIYGAIWGIGTANGRLRISEETIADSPQESAEIPVPP